MRDAWFYIFIGSFVIGVAFHSVVYLGTAFTFFSFGLSLSIFLLYLFLGKQKTILLVSLGILAFSFGLLRFDVRALNTGDSILDAKLEKQVTLEGVIITEPDERERSTRLTVKLKTLNGEALSSKALVITERFPRFQYGDRVTLEGIITQPANFESASGREFNYVSFLEKDGIFYTLFFPSVTLLSSEHGHPVKSVLFTIKRTFLRSVEQFIPEPHVSLLGGLLVGAKQSLGDELTEKFRKTGIIHIVVLSGYNVTIVAEAIMRFFSFLPRMAGISLGAFSIVLFAILTGASATIVRASIMALLVILARATERTYAITRALFLAGFFMVLHNPMIVLFDPSFQLSFLATIGLIYLAPQIERYFKLVPSRWKLREFATATIATQLFVLPLLLYMMGEMSLVALPVNLLILGFIPVTMLFGFLTGIIGFIPGVLAMPFGFVTQLFLSYELFVVDIFSAIPFAAVAIPVFPLWVMLLLYFFYGLLLLKLWQRVNTKTNSSIF